MTFNLIPETGCGQSPRSLVNTGNHRKIESQRHKISYTLVGNLVLTNAEDQ